ncbi:MAG: esterase, partial [bacterium]
MRDYLGGRRSRAVPVADRGELENFLQTRASYVSQISLFGYLRTRTGVRFPELFDDDHFVASINQAKWHLWLACLSDVSVYAGLLILRRTNHPVDAVRGLMQSVLDAVLATV